MTFARLESFNHAVLQCISCIMVTLQGGTYRRPRREAGASVAATNTSPVSPSNIRGSRVEHNASRSGGASRTTAAIRAIHGCAPRIWRRPRVTPSAPTPLSLSEVSEYSEVSEVSEVSEWTSQRMETPGAPRGFRTLRTLRHRPQSASFVVLTCGGVRFGHFGHGS